MGFLLSICKVGFTERKFLVYIPTVLNIGVKVTGKIDPVLTMHHSMKTCWKSGSIDRSMHS
jgi:hypothetical protein